LSTGDATFAERSKRAMDDMLTRAGTVFLVNHAAQTIENMCSRAIWMERGRIVMDGDAVEVARKYRWFAHNLAQGDEDKAAGLLQDAMDEGAEQRRLTALRLGDAEALEDPSPGRRRRREFPELEPDPFMQVFSRDAEKKTFPTGGAHRTDARSGRSRRRAMPISAHAPPAPATSRSRDIMESTSFRSPRSSSVSLRVMTIFGTRPEAIKLAPIIRAIEDDDEMENVIVVTGQHREMLDQVNSLFEITPHHDLDIMAGEQ